MTKQSIKKDLEETQIKLYRLNRKSYDRGAIIVILTALSICLFFLLCATNVHQIHNREGINENKYCLKLLQKHWPEYGWESAKYYGSNYIDEKKFTCEGTYKSQNKGEKRDGTTEILGTVQKQKTYKLTTEHTNYLESDVEYGDLLWILYILASVAAFVSIMTLETEFLHLMG